VETDLSGLASSPDLGAFEAALGLAEAAAAKLLADAQSAAAPCAGHPHHRVKRPVAGVAWHFSRCMALMSGFSFSSPAPQPGECRPQVKAPRRPARRTSSIAVMAGPRAGHLPPAGAAPRHPFSRCMALMQGFRFRRPRPGEGSASRKSQHHADRPAAPPESPSWPALEPAICPPPVPPCAVRSHHRAKRPVAGVAWRFSRCMALKSGLSFSPPASRRRECQPQVV